MSLSEEIRDRLLPRLEALEKGVEVDYEARKLLNEMYNIIGAEAYYDPYNDATREFAKRLDVFMVKLNEKWKFRL